MEEKPIEEKDDFRERIVEIVVTLGFHISTMGSLYSDPRYYSEKQVLGMLITQISDITKYFMERFQITEDEYKERVSRYIKEDQIITIERDTGSENVEFG